MILVAGSANLDFVVRVPHIPAHGETVLGHDFTTYPGGKGANQAVAAARAGGVPTSMLLALGGDSYGEQLKQALEKDRITLHCITTDNRSGCAFITVSDDAENAITVVPGANHDLRPADWQKVANSGAQFLLLQLEIPLDCVKAYAQAAHDEGLKVVLNAAPAPKLPADLLEILDLVDVLIVNQGELSLMAQAQKSEPQNIEHTIVQQLNALPCHSVIVTLGSKGACARVSLSAQVSTIAPSEENVYFYQPAFQVNAVDTTGAGDTFCGAFIAACINAGVGEQRDLLADKKINSRSWLAALRYASAASALACTKMGAQSSIPTRDQVLDFLQARPHHTEAEYARLSDYCAKVRT